MTSHSTAASASRSSATKIENSGAPAKRQQRGDRPRARARRVRRPARVDHRCGPGQQALGRCDNASPAAKSSGIENRQARTPADRTAGTGVRRRARTPSESADPATAPIARPASVRRSRPRASRSSRPRAAVRCRRRRTTGCARRPPAARPGPTRRTPRSRAARGAELLPRRGSDPRAAARSDGPELSTSRRSADCAGERGDQPDECRLRPASERIARADVHHDQRRAPCRTPASASRCATRAPASASGAMSTASRAGSGVASGHPSIA